MTQTTNTTTGQIPADLPADVTTTQKRVPLDRIDRNPDQPRQLFDDNDIAALAQSLATVGQIQAITCTYDAKTRRYTIVAGERRVRAARIAGLTDMLVTVLHGADDVETFIRSIAENVGRVDMTPLEEARAFAKMIGHDWTPEDIAKAVGRRADVIRWRLDLLRLIPALLTAVEDGALSANTAWYAAQLTETGQTEFHIRWADGKFATARDAEAFCRELRKIETGEQDVTPAPATTGDTDGADDGDDTGAAPAAPRAPLAHLMTDVQRVAIVVQSINMLLDADPRELAALFGSRPGGTTGALTALRAVHAQAGKLVTHVSKGAAQIEAAAAAAPAATADADSGDDAGTAAEGVDAA